MIQMAVKRTTKKAGISSTTRAGDSADNSSQDQGSSSKGIKSKSGKKLLRIAGLVVVVAAIFAGFWYKTNSWPVVAMVGTQPVTRFEVNQELFSQYGKDAVENKITEILVRNELKRQGITVGEDEIQKQMNDIKGRLGEGVDLSTVLADRGMTMQEFQDQLKLQLGVEKALSDKITVTDQEVQDYLSANKDYINASGEAAISQAKEAIKYNKLQEQVGTWIDSLMANAKIWRVPGL